MKNNITVYTTSTCPYCEMMKRFLTHNNLEFTEVNVQKDPIAANRLVQETGQYGVPQTNINGEWVLGFDQARVMQLVK
ncbi:glutaredoxin family protein [Fundicoccus culcitae]|uniref:Glutaredoxin family protein n=1 Tax=Fundicoccus culcitae TaxID=2969821 RepID=A0ABY5P3Z9_9LACT|nr:glutaredoxin domain-containing protein [Fundicoccus culcitae]UUX33452.1 glutaredoxin family protein [Fundicoccus culcitae]